MKANTPGACIEIGSNGRYAGVANVYGRVLLGSGSQILGNITAYDFSLAAGGSHRDALPDERGAVLKGSGTARAIHLMKGQVIEGWDAFSTRHMTMQSSFHPAKQPERR